MGNNYYSLSFFVFDIIFVELCNWSLTVLT